MKTRNEHIDTELSPDAASLAGTAGGDELLAALERLEHQNRVLRSIMKIKNLVETESDAPALAGRTCAALVENRGYHNAWMVLFEPGPVYGNPQCRVSSMAQESVGGAFAELQQRIERGEMTPCIRSTLSRPGVTVIKDPVRECPDCPLAAEYEGRGGLSRRLEHGGALYGILTVSVPGSFATDREEQFLFDELAGAVSYALHGIEARRRMSRTEELLEESTVRFETIYDQAAVGIAIISPEGEWVHANRKLRDIFSYREDELAGSSIMEVLVMDMDSYRDTHRLLRGELETVWLNMQFINRYRVRGWISFNASLVRDSLGKPRYAVAVITDITDEKNNRERIDAALKEKEILLKEIHHRVKNNMQVVTSLINLQSDQVDDPEFTELMVECRNRIRSMALVHEKLYQSGNLAEIAMDEYLLTLVGELSRSYNTGGRVEILVESEGVRMNIEKAIPCAIIVNELVTNAMKYAFPDGARGEVRVGFRVRENGACALTVSDNGAGFPRNITIEESSTLGMQLVSALTRELKGNITLDRDGGTCFTIEFE